MYAVIGGIDLDPELPGYKHIIMHPQPGGGLTYATSELHSLYGVIRSAWTLENNNFTGGLQSLRILLRQFMCLRKMSLISRKVDSLPKVQPG
jgi:hypothetical protein